MKSILLILSLWAGAFANAARDTDPDIDALLEQAWARARVASEPGTWPTPLPATFDRRPVPISDAGVVDAEWSELSHRFSKSFRIAVAFLRARRTVAASAELSQLERILAQLNLLANRTGVHDALSRVIQDGVKMALADFEPLRDEDRERLHAFAVDLGKRIDSLDQINAAIRKSVGRERRRLLTEHAKAFAGFGFLSGLVLNTFGGAYLDHPTTAALAALSAALMLKLTWTPLPAKPKDSAPNLVRDQWARCTALLERAGAGPHLP